MRSLEGLWFEDMEKKRKKKSGVDLSKTMASPSAPPPSVEPTSASTATPPPVEVATATPPPVEANVATDVSATKVAEAPAPPPPTSTPALSEASAEAVLAKVDLAKVAVPRSQDSSRKLVAAVDLVGGDSDASERSRTRQRPRDSRLHRGWMLTRRASHTQHRFVATRRVVSRVKPHVRSRCAPT